MTIRDWYMPYHYNRPHSEPSGVQIIIDNDGGAGYDWDIVSLVRRPLGDGRFEYAIYEDSGCSCSYAYEEGPESYDLDWQPHPFTLIKRANLSTEDRIRFREALEESIREPA